MGIAILGPVTVDGAPGALRHHDRVVLTALAIRIGEPVSADRLADALWGDEPPETWPKVVQGCVVRLRKVLGAEAIETTTHGYRLALPSEELDSRRFERLLGRGRELLDLAEPERAAYVLSEAMSLWRGPALLDIDGWAGGRVESARLDELRRDAEELAVDAALRAGRAREVVGDAQRLVGEAPLRERRWALLALAQYHCGQQAQALRTLRQVRAVLATELGLDPGPELVALERAILRQDPHLVVASALPEPEMTCPWRGLVPYGLRDADAFFGRDQEVAECLRRLASNGVLAVVGPSGSGKSSLVRAGVAAGLVREGRRVHVVTPGRHPADVLTGLSESGSAPVLVVDQCEEAVTQCESAEERVQFFDALAAHAERAPLVLALRADHLGSTVDHTSLARLLERGLFLIGPMGEHELRAVIEQPARQSGLLLEPGLVDLLIREIEGAAGALPLLSHALRETWANREGRTLTVAGYQASGGIREAVARSAEEIYERIPESSRPIVRDLMLRLVTSAPDGAPVRSQVPRRLVTDDEDHEAVVEELVRARLLTSDGDVLVLAHEALVQAWPRFQQWLEDDTEGQRILRHLAVAADTWDSMERPDSELYRGVRLAQALDWRQQTAPDLTAVEDEFLSASQALVDAELAQAHRRVQQERTARRRTRRLAAGLAVTLVLALLAAAGATAFQRSASERAIEAATASTEADANRLAALSKSVRGIDLSMLLAAQAFRTADTPATRDGLLAALLDHARAEQVLGVENVVFSGALAERGRTLFVNGHSQLFAWKVGSSEPPRVMLRWGNKVDYIAGAPTDDLVALWQYREDGTPAVGVFDSEGRERFLLEGREVGGAPMGFGFSPDSRHLYLHVLGEDGLRPHGIYLREYDLASGDLLRNDLVHRAPSPGHHMFSMMSKDAAWSVSWPEGDLRSAVMTATRTGRRVRLAVPERPAEPTWYFPVSTGTALVWADGAVSLYDATGRQTQVLDAHRARVTDVVVAPDGRWAATGDSSGVVTLWDVDRASGIWSPREVLPGLAGSTGLTVSPDSSRLVTLSGEGTIVLWDLTADAGLGSSIPGLGSRGWMSNRPAEVVPGRLVVAPTRDGVGEWWAQNRVSATFLDPRTGEVVDHVYAGRIAEAVIGSSVSVSPDRSLVAVTYQVGTVVLDARTRDKVARITLDPLDAGGQPENVWCSAWTPDGSKLLLCAEGVDTDGEDGNLVVVDTTTWQVAERRVVVDGSVQTAEFSPDGTLLALGMVVPSADSAAPATVKILDATSFEVLREVELGPDQMALDVSFSPDGRRLAVAGITGLLSVADVSTGTLLHEQAQAHTRIEQVEWLPDNRTIVSAGPDSKVTLYDENRGLVRATMPVTVDAADAAQTFLLKADRGEVTATVRDRGGRTYPLDPQVWLDRACAIVGRDLTRDEWSSYLPDQPYERTCGGRT